MEPVMVIAVGVGLFIAITNIWWAVCYLLQMVKIEELEQELRNLK